MNDMTSRVLVALSVATAALVAQPAMASAAVLPATPATFHSVFSAAHAGDVIELGSGNYGDFTGAEKPGTVTIQALPGATATMEVDFSSAGDLRLEGLTVHGASITGSSHDITIADSRFTDQAVVRAEQMVNAGIVFAHDTFANIDACGSCYEGRLEVMGEGPGPSGVTIESSTFGPGGDADGIQIGGTHGVRVLGNEFLGIRQGDSGPHTDSIQLMGTTQTLIEGNYFHGDTTSIMAPDGGAHELITDNVFVGTDYRPAVQLGSQTGTIFEHNTLKHIDVHAGSKTGESASSGMAMVDNLLVDGAFSMDDGSGCRGCTVNSNLFDQSRNTDGTHALVGTPRFVGGADPSGYAGYALAAGSPGKGAASDHTDMGARVTGTAGAGGAPAPAPPQASRRRVIRMSLRVPGRISWARLRRGLHVRVTAQERLRLSFRLARKGAKRALVSRRRSMAHGRRTFVLRPKRARLGRRRAQRVVLTVTARNGAGTQRRLRRTIRVTR
jgi:hypothetical protein